MQQTGVVDAETVQRFARLARYWDRLANSGRFVHTLALLLADGGVASPFYAFLALADWLWRDSEQISGKTSGLSPESLVDALSDYLCGQRGLSATRVQQVLLADYLASGARGSPRTLAGVLPKRDAPRPSRRALAPRQDRHLAVRRRAG